MTIQSAMKSRRYKSRYIDMKSRRQSKSRYIEYKEFLASGRCCDAGLLDGTPEGKQLLKEGSVIRVEGEFPYYANPQAILILKNKKKQVNNLG